MIASLAAVGLGPGFGSTTGRRPAPVQERTPLAAETPTNLQTYDAPALTIDASQPHKAIIRTDKGDIEIELATDAPEAVNSFAFLAGNGFYNGLTFFYVDKNFFAQAGDPTCDAAGKNTCTGSGGPGYTRPLEKGSESHEQWAVVAPAVIEGQEVHGSQFRILFAPNQRLDGRETVFGKVVAGQDLLSGLQDYIPCFDSKPSASNRCSPDLNPSDALVIKEIIVQPA